MTTISGARTGQPTWLRRLMARAMAADLTAFVVPDVAIARAHGLDLAAAGLRRVATPRHANVLLLVGEIPERLRPAAAVVYAQMPRPRAILALESDGDGAPPLPAPDVTARLDQDALAGGVHALRHLIATDTWSSHTAPFDAPPLHDDEKDGDKGHEGHGGMDHGPMPHDQHGDMGHDGDGDGHGHQPGHAEHGARGGSSAQPHAEEHAGHLLPMDAPGPHREHASDSGHKEHERGDGQDHNAHAEQMDVGHAEMHDDHDDREDMQHGDHGPNNTHDRGGMDHGHRGHGGMQHDAQGGMDGMNHGNMEMDMGGGGMSMVMITKDLPRSPDGLPMDWVEAPFGPLVPGLPGGLMLTLTLDGDAVAGAAVTPGTVARGLEETWTGPASDFPARLARLDHFTPVTYRLLAIRALEDAAGITVDDATASRRVGALERERAASHLGWLARLGALLGARWLEERAAALELALRRTQDTADVARRRADVVALAHHVEQNASLRWRLQGIGRLNPGSSERQAGAEHVTAGARWVPSSPVSRASGHASDARQDDPAYRRLGFAPVVHQGDDALARLRVRVGELVQSLDLVLAVGEIEMADLALDTPPIPPMTTGTGTATIETPRGTAALSLHLDGDTVRDVRLETPSTHLVTLVAPVATGQEVGDALAGIASLDLSPWEIDR